MRADAANAISRRPSSQALGWVERLGMRSVIRASRPPWPPAASAVDRCARAALSPVGCAISSMQTATARISASSWPGSISTP